MGGFQGFSLGKKRKRVGTGVTAEPTEADEKDENNASNGSEHQNEVAPPQDVETKRACERLADFIRERGEAFEEVARRKHGAQGTFRFLLDQSSNEYKYYRKVLQEKQAQTGKPMESHAQSNTTSRYHSHAEQHSGPNHHDYQAMEQASNTSSATQAKQTDEVLPIERTQPTQVTTEEIQLAASSELSSASTDTLFTEQPEKDEPSFERARASLRHMAAKAAGELLQAEEDELHGLHKPAKAPQKAAPGDLLPREVIASIDPRSPTSGNEAGATPSQALGERAGLGMQHQAQKAQDNEPKDEFERFRKLMAKAYEKRPNPLGNPRRRDKS